MLRNMIVDAFEAFAWVFFIGFIAFGTWFGWWAAKTGYTVTALGMPHLEIWQGVVAGFVAGTICAVVGTGLIFTLLDIRAGTDRITYLMERELRGRRTE